MAKHLNSPAPAVSLFCGPLLSYEGALSWPLTHAVCTLQNQKLLSG